MPTKPPTPPPKPQNILAIIAEKNGRNYITPEDVGEAMKQNSSNAVMRDLLLAMSGRYRQESGDPWA